MINETEKDWFNFKWKLVLILLNGIVAIPIVLALKTVLTEEGFGDIGADMGAVVLYFMWVILAVLFCFLHPILRPIGRAIEKNIRGSKQ